MRISIVFFLSSYVLFYQTKQNTVVLIQLKSIILCVRSCALDWWAFPAVSTDGKFLASFTACSSVVLCSAVALSKGREWIPEGIWGSCHQYGTEAARNHFWLFPPHRLWFVAWYLCNRRRRWEMSYGCLSKDGHGIVCRLKYAYACVFMSVLQLLSSSILPTS